MAITRLTTTAASLALAAAVSCAAAPCDFDFTPVTQLVQSNLAPLGLPGAVIIVERAGTILYQRAFGSYALSAVVPSASSAKWISGAVVMSVVDSGELSLDSTTAQVLGWTGPKGTITLRQLFSHTSGLRDAPCLGDPTITLAQCVDQIYLNEQLLFAPGSAFLYGGASMQVAGRMCEVATGRPWTQLFNERLRAPLGFTITQYTPIGTPNPWIAGGAQITAGEYVRMLRMIANGGTYGGVRVLSEGSVRAMLADQTGGAPPIGFPPTLNQYLGYGVGNWLWRANPLGYVVDSSSPGALGVSPWIDRERNLACIFLVRNSLQNVDALVDSLQPLIRSIVDAGTFPGDANFDGIVDFADLSAVLGGYGQVGGALPGDVDHDGRVGFSDLAIVLGSFGSGCM